MSGVPWIGVVTILGALILFGANLRRRDLPRATLWRYAAIWAAVFGALFVLASRWRDFT